MISLAMNFLLPWNTPKKRPWLYPWPYYKNLNNWRL